MAFCCKQLYPVGYAAVNDKYNVVIDGYFVRFSQSSGIASFPMRNDRHSRRTDICGIKNPVSNHTYRLVLYFIYNRCVVVSFTVEQYLTA